LGLLEQHLTSIVDSISDAHPTVSNHQRCFVFVIYYFIIIFFTLGIKNPEQFIIIINYLLFVMFVIVV